MQREKLTYDDIRKLVNEWADEIGVDPTDQISYPYRPNEKNSIRQTMWKLYQEERVNSVRSLKAFFDRTVEPR